MIISRGLPPKIWYAANSQMAATAIRAFSLAPWSGARLMKPPPMWGSVPQSAAGSKEENIDPASNNRSQREAPLPGTSNPFGTPRPSTVTQ